MLVSTDSDRRAGAYIIGMIKKEREAASAAGGPQGGGYQRNSDGEQGGRSVSAADSRCYA